jgi:hypothetical protein
LQQTAPLEVKSAGIEPRPSHTLPRSGSRSLATSEHDSTCFPSASSARLEHPGGWPSRLLRAPGHEGVRCWYVATRTSDPDQSKSPLGISTIPHGAMRLIQFAARSTTTPSRTAQGRPAANFRVAYIIHNYPGSLLEHPPVKLSWQPLWSLTLSILEASRST